MAFYGIEVVVRTDDNTKDKMLVAQRKLRRKVLNASYYIRNKDLAKDLDLRDILVVGEEKNMVLRLETHRNVKIRALAERLWDTGPKVYFEKLPLQ